MTNETIYPYGTDGHLPSSIGIINDLRTGGANKALSAEMGKEIGDFILPTEVFDLSEGTEITAYITAQNPLWLTGNSNYKCNLVAVSAGDEFQLCGNGVSSFYYAALTDNSVSSSPSFAKGYSRPVMVASDACVLITIPEGASYLYLSTKINGVDVTPSVYSFRQPGAESLFLDMLSKQLWRKLPLYEYETLRAYITGQGTWMIDNYNYSCKLIPVTEGEKYRITSSTKNCQYAFLEDDTRPGSASFVESFNSVQMLEAGSTIELTIPTGCTILYIAVETTTYILPEKVEVLNTDSGSLLATIKSLFPIANDYNGGTNRVLSAEKGKELNEMVSGYENISLTSTENAHLAININEWLTGSSRRCLFIPVSAGDKFKIISSDDNSCYYAFVRDSAPVNYTKPEYAEGYVSPNALMAGDEILITAPDNATKLYVSIYNGKESVAPSAVKRLSKESALYEAVRLIDEYSQGRSTLPSALKAGEPTNIIYTIDDFLMAHEYDENNNVDQFLFSNDLGETWSAPVVNRWGVLNNIFMFADGTLIFAGYKEEEGSKWYWTRDFNTFNDCTVIDYNGDYIPEAGVRRFGEIQAKTHHVYVDGEEYYCFGDYIIGARNPRIWYALSDVSGVTIRSAFAFGIQSIDDVVIPARHYHSFDFNPYDGKFYALTGDSDTTECNILRGIHDENHVWTWERVAYGAEYKLASISFDAGNMYAITDYTASTLRDKKGLLSVPINDIRAERFRYWFKPSSEFMATGNGAALSASIVDNHGWRVIGLDYQGNSKLLIAKGGHNFVWVDNDAGVKMKGWIGPNNKGDVYVWWNTPGFNVGNDDWVKYSHRTTYNFTAIMRNSGATDFFDGWVGTPK